MTVAAVRPRPTLRFRGRSFMALVLAPEPPLEDWFAELDGLIRRSPGFFIGRPVVLDVSALGLDKEGLARIVADLAARDIRIMGIEGTNPSFIGLGMPPLISGGRQVNIPDPTEAPPAPTPPRPTARQPAAAAPATAAPQPAQRLTGSLLFDRPIRSGQSIVFPEGDVTVVGSVASGAEIIAGGSIHIYGTMRGRAIAGSTGNSDARIFCSKLEAELLAIDGLYQTADEMDPAYRGRAVHARLEGEAFVLAALN